MKALFEDLFLAYCVPYDPSRFPEYRHKDPTRAYGQYAFEEGFKLALKLAVACLDPEDLCEEER